MDIHYLLWLQAFRESIGGAADKAMMFLSEFGSDILPIAVAALLYWCINKKNGRFLLTSFSLGTLLYNIVKLTFCVYRPWIRDSRVVPVEEAAAESTSYSFPSGHSSNAVEIYGGLGWCYRRKKLFAALMFLLVALVMFSRNYLGVHTPQDVLVGAALGILSLVLSEKMLDFTERGTNHDIIAALGCSILCVVSLLYILNKSYPMDMANGVLLVDPVKMQQSHFTACGLVLGTVWGIVLEKRLIHFDVSGSILVRTVRYLVGIAGTLFLYKSVRGWLQLLLGSAFGRLLGVSLAMLFVTAVYPLLFQAAEHCFLQEKH